MHHYSTLAVLVMIPLALAAQPRLQPPRIDDATAYCRFVTRKKLDNPPGLVWTDPLPVVKDRRGHLTVRVAYRVDGGTRRTATCKVRPLANGDMQEIR
jgi:hypothetical protein